jgi:hypothetical protein
MDGLRPKSFTILQRERSEYLGVPEGSFFKRSRSFARWNQSLRHSPNSKKNERIFNLAVFALAFFAGRQDRELLGAISRGLLDCPCEFKLHRLRHGFSLSNPLLLDIARLSRKSLTLRQTMMAGRRWERSF